MASLLKLTGGLNSKAASLSRLCSLSCSKSTAAPTVREADSSTVEDSPKPFSEMPGEKGWPIVGTTFKFLRKMGDGSTGKESLFYQLHEKYGPILRMKSVGNNWTVFASGPEAAAAMYRAEGKYPCRGKIMEHNMYWIHKKNNWPAPMLFASGEDWKRIRSAISKQVIPRRVANLTEPLCEVADNFIAHLEDISAETNGRIDDIKPSMTKWAFQGVSYFVFGEKLNVYDESDVTQKRFITAGIEFIRTIAKVSPLPIYKLFPTKSYRELVKAIGDMRELGKQVMERKFQQLSEDISKGTVDETRAVGILDQWLIEGKLDPEDALTQACDLLAAGLDTTNNTTTFMIYELAKQPALQDQLCREIKSVLGDRPNPTWEDLQSIPLIRYCVKETLRLYPAIQVGVRQIGKDAVINGYIVPAGTSVLISQAVMSKSEDYFEDPLTFKPERWNKANEESIDAFSSLPFGFGQRGCYGRRLAELEMYVLLTKLIPKYHLSTDKESLKLIQKTVLLPQENVPITITPRTA